MNMYFVAIVAPGDIDIQVLQWKHWMKARYMCEVALRAPAHITLVPPFWMKPELENSLIDSVTAFSINQKGFHIQLNNFSHFKSRVLFVDLAPNEWLTKLKNELLDFLLKSGQYPVKDDKLPSILMSQLPPEICTRRLFMKLGNILKIKNIRRNGSCRIFPC